MCLSCSVAPFFFFFGGCPTKMDFPKKGSLFFQVTEQLRCGDAGQTLAPQIACEQNVALPEVGDSFG